MDGWECYQDSVCQSKRVFHPRYGKLVSLSLARYWRSVVEYLCLLPFTLFSFFDNIERFADDRCVPSNDDILHARWPTTKITDTVFHIDRCLYHVVDVGGQMKYRLAWPRFFDAANAIIFVASLAAYDQFMEEKDFTKRNRMVDSLNLFESIINHELLKNISIILLLNKVDLATLKIQGSSSIKSYFPHFSGKVHLI